MDKGKDLQGFSRILDDREEYLVDRDRGVCDPFLSVGSVSVSEEKLWQYNLQGNDILNACKSFLYYFAVEQILHFPEFAEWCAVNYSSSQRVIVSQSTSRILCKIDVNVIRENLNFPDNYPDCHEPVNESILAELYKNCGTEAHCKFLSSILNEGQSLDGLFPPYHVRIFRDEVQLVVSLVCQVMGLDDDCHVNEVILGFLLKISSLGSESQSIPVFNIDEYLAETIHLQLSEFPKARFFKFQTYLLNMLLCSNVTELQFLSTMFSPDFPKQIRMFEFANSIMSEIYRMLFDEVLPRVLEEMKCMMQPSPED